MRVRGARAISSHFEHDLEFCDVQTRSRHLHLGEPCDKHKQTHFDVDDSLCRYGFRFRASGPDLLLFDGRF